MDLSMPESLDNDPTVVPTKDSSPHDELTRSYVPSRPEEAEVSANERETQLRLTGGRAEPLRPSTEDAPLTCVGRYVILREIGRGGMGMVLEADDPQLCRRLAIKVLLEPYQHDALLVRRFLDEARICGQLQHPGIVPIHEIGRLPDQRPFFAMKLIQGQTLASLLQTRSDPADDLPRFLTIFEQVCQTMAYAHAKGIIHRDLKPSNIMAGSFGEVQVMDWGLAKVLTPVGWANEGGPPMDCGGFPSSAHPTPDLRDNSATSLAGTILGTPGYMAPEQARGDSEQIDARCDVFGLGALLCVILTGKPPYEGSTHAQVYRQAVEGDLRDAHARLAESSAHAELIALARQCLAAEPKDRPADAGVVARKMTNYRASVAERLRAVELERAAAQVKAAGERKARRLTLALATAAIALLLLSAGGWFWLEHERTEKRLLTARAVEERVQQALRLREKGRSAAVAELSPWVEALDNVQAAADRLSGDADPALRARIEQLRAELETEVRDRRMLARLEEIRLNKSQSKNFDFRQAAGDYAAAFREYGIDVEHLPDEQAAEHIGGRDIAAELAAALDDWAEACGEAEVRKHLLNTARQADGDLWRQRLRAALLEHDRDALADAARAPEVHDLPPTTLYLLGQALADVGDSIESIRLLRRAQRQHPDDFWINFRLALQLELAKPPRPREATRFYTAALAVRKQSAAAHMSLAIALHTSNALDEAIAEYREALRLQQDFILAHYNLANALKDKGQNEEALAEYREAIRLKPTYVEAHNNLGALLSDIGRLDEACHAFRKAIEIKANHASSHHNLALALMHLQRLDDALAACQKAVYYEGNAGYYNTLGQLLEKKDRPGDARAAYQKAIELDKDYSSPHHNLGLLYLRMGKTKQGQAELQEALRLQPKDATAWFELGLTSLQQHEPGKAVAAFRKVVAIEPKNIKAWVNLGTALANDGQVDASITTYEQALRIDPKSLAVWMSLGASYRRKGDANSAIDAYRHAVAVAKDDADAHNSLGTALAERGRFAEAVGCFREAIRLRPDFAWACNNLGNALGAQGEFEEAVQAYDKAIRLKPDYTRAKWNRGQIFKEWGKLKEAIAAYREALADDPNDAWVHCLLGLALREQGKLREARDALERGHELGIRQKGWQNPSERWLSQCQRQIERDKKLPAFRRGEIKPADSEERIAWATLCLQVHRYYADAAELFRTAFADRPALAEKYRYQAACAAALAGCGQDEGADKMTEAERAGWRKQALEWLRTDLELLRMRSERGSEGLRGSVRKTLRRWQDDPSLAGLRERKAIERLPKEEREACQQLWEKVNKMLETTTPAS
jgi:eukaryotic-like serine/threonine-protein kinase